MSTRTSGRAIGALYEGGVWRMMTRLRSCPKCQLRLSRQTPSFNFRDIFFRIGMAAIATPRAGRVGRGACPAHIALPAVHEHPPLSAPRSAPLDSTPAHNPPPGTHEDAFSTPTAGPLAEGVEPCMQLMPFFCETPAVPTTLEFRSATKLKEKRRQRQLARSPYAKPTRQGKGGGEGSVGARRRLLEEEQQRLLGLPRGQYSRHRLSLVGKALEIL